MINKIIHTLGSRLIIAILSFGLLLITTRIMGAEVKGEISLLVLNISIATIVSGLFGGPALVYLANRNSIRTLLIINSVWTLVACGAMSLLIATLNGTSEVSALRFFRMSVLESLIATNFMLMLGHERISWHNVLQVIKVTITVAALLILLQVRENSVELFADAYEISLVFTILLSSAPIWRLLQVDDAQANLASAIRACLKYGGLVQIGNVAQLLNYRLSYYILEICISPPQLALVRIGIYSASMQVAESLWQFTRSVNTVQYARISNIKEKVEALGISIRLIRLNYTVTVFGVLIIFLIPIHFFEALFGAEFLEIKAHFLLLSPGIIALAFGGAINHFFAGIGEHRYNTYNSIFGLGLTLALAYPLIKHLDTQGAAIATSIVYCLQAILQVWFLNRNHKTSLSDFLIRRSDFKEIISGMYKVWNRRSS